MPGQLAIVRIGRPIAPKGFTPIHIDLGFSGVIFEDTMKALPVGIATFTPVIGRST
jgi:hypothetical protein